MNSAKLSTNELIDIIQYGIKENGIDVRILSNKKINKIINRYNEYCNLLEKNYVNGELDTFKRAACLLVAINKGKITEFKRLNAYIALDAAYKMCEKPYWNIGEHFDIPTKLEEVNYKEIFENDMYAFETSKENLTDSLMYGEASPLDYSLNLELLYQLALQIKHKNEEKINDEMPVKKLTI